MQQHNSSACCIILRPLKERSSEYCIIKHCSIEIKEWIQENNEYVLSYILPRDINAGQPMIKDLSFAHNFKSYAGLLRAG